jgi:hypothetical protein
LPGSVVELRAWEEFNEELYQREIRTNAEETTSVKSFDEPQRGAAKQSKIGTIE